MKDSDQSIDPYYDILRRFYNRMDTRLPATPRDLLEMGDDEVIVKILEGAMKLCGSICDMEEVDDWHPIRIVNQVTDLANLGAMLSELHPDPEPHPDLFD